MTVLFVVLIIIQILCISIGFAEAMDHWRDPKRGPFFAALPWLLGAIVIGLAVKLVVTLIGGANG